MWTRGWAVLAAGLAAVHTGGIMFGAPVPWTGTLTLAALTGLVWARGGSRALRAGFAAFTLLAFTVEARSGGAGWPENLNAASGTAWRVLEGGLLLAALAGVTTAVVRRGGRRLRMLLPIAGLALVVATVFASWVQADLDRQRVAAFRSELRLQQSKANTAAPMLAMTVAEPEVPQQRSWSFDPWNGDVDWEATAQAVPAMFVTVVSALVAGLAGRRDDEEYISANIRW